MSLKQLKEELVAAILADVEKVEGIAEEVGEKIAAIFEKHKTEATTETEQAAGSDAQVVSQADLDAQNQAVTDAQNDAAAAKQEAADAASGVDVKVARAEQNLAAERDAHDDTKKQLVAEQQAHAETQSELDVTVQKLEHAENLVTALNLDANGARELAQQARDRLAADAARTGTQVLAPHGTPANVHVEGTTVKPTGSVALPINTDTTKPENVAQADLKAGATEDAANQSLQTGNPAPADPNDQAVQGMDPNAGGTVSQEDAKKGDFDKA